jgi:hypothetical protein
MNAPAESLVSQMRSAAEALATFNRLYGRDEGTGQWSPQALKQAADDLDRPISAARSR